MPDPALLEDTTTPSFPRVRPANVYMRPCRRNWGPDQRTPPARVARHRLHAPMLVPMIPPRIHAAPAHPARMNGPNTHVPARTQHAPGNKPLCILQPRARDAGNKITASAHGMGSGGSSVDARVIGCLGVERRAERFFSYLAILRYLFFPLAPCYCVYL